MTLSEVIRPLYLFAARVAFLFLGSSVLATVVAYAVLPDFRVRVLPGCYLTSALVPYIACLDFLGAQWLAAFLNLPGTLIFGMMFSIVALSQIAMTIIQSGGFPPGTIPAPALLLRVLTWIVFAVLGPFLFVLSIAGFKVLLGDVRRWRRAKSQIDQR